MSRCRGDLKKLQQESIGFGRDMTGTHVPWCCPQLNERMLAYLTQRLYSRLYIFADHFFIPLTTLALKKNPNQANNNKPLQSICP